MITFDFHTHVCMSSAREMVDAAPAKGITEIGFAEHIYQLDEGYAIISDQPQEGPRITLDQYVAAVRGEHRPDVAVRLGLEVDLVPYGREQIDALLAKVEWDFLLGSVHQVEGNNFEDPQTFERDQGLFMWRRYFELIEAAIVSGRFDVVTHPVRMRLRNEHVPTEIDDVLHVLAAKARDHDVALELNGNDVVRSLPELRLLAKACADEHCPISIGSDAHRPQDIARAHAETAKIMAEFGLKTARVFERRKYREVSVVD